MYRKPHLSLTTDYKLKVLWRISQLMGRGGISSFSHPLMTVVIKATLCSNAYDVQFGAPNPRSL